ncbi:hypothetical protein IGL98_002475 [Enterococcus sp. DIV0840]|uniref:hypothetical protein n=1 Tax=unclassified Enterococcus TaxID=2608891 RepID=UPI001A8FB630|nr:hypothetical protein [Enterococcus sp. DIV0849a]MBO0434017.1 hypothetical protein [Enterococcus sp. DIV0849a]
MEKNIMKNDVYILKTTQNYIILNDNYEGLIVLDKNLNFSKKIYVAEDLFIYQAYSSELNDYVVIQDVENDILYSINIETNDIKKRNWKDIFSIYYYVEQEQFSLNSKKTKYQFFYNELNEVVYFKEELVNGTILSNCQETILYNTKTNELNYNDKVIQSPPTKVEQYKVDKDLILSYSEKYLYVFFQGNWNLLYEAEEQFSIRECSFSLGLIYVLVNNKSNIEQSLVQVISL